MSTENLGCELGWRRGGCVEDDVADAFDLEVLLLAPATVGGRVEDLGSLIDEPVSGEARPVASTACLNTADQFFLSACRRYSVNSAAGSASRYKWTCSEVSTAPDSTR